MIDNILEEQSFLRGEKMKSHEELERLALKLSDIFSKAGVFRLRYEESTNEGNRKGWEFCENEKLLEVGACLQELSNKEIFLLLERFERSDHSPAVALTFFRSFLGDRFVQLLRYEVEQERIPITGPHDGGYDGDWN